MDVASGSAKRVPCANCTRPLRMRPQDDGLEHYARAHSPANIGVLFVRKARHLVPRLVAPLPRARTSRACARQAGLELVEEWNAMLERDEKIWDQNAFNDLFRQGAGEELPGRLFKAYQVRARRPRTPPATRRQFRQLCVGRRGKSAWDCFPSACSVAATRSSYSACTSSSGRTRTSCTRHFSSAARRASATACARRRYGRATDPSTTTRQARSVLVASLQLPPDQRPSDRNLRQCRRAARVPPGHS